MATIVRVDAPAHIRRYSTSVDLTGWTCLAGLCLICIGGGVVALIIMMVGGEGWGAVICEAWTALWVWVLVWALRVRGAVRRWHQPIGIGEWIVEDAHSDYWGLSPETRTAYGLPLIESLYRLSMIEVRGQPAREQVITRMEQRRAALRTLVDAEDRLRLYVAEPALADDDDLNAVAAFDQAIAEIEKALYSDDVTR
jgi:hypothetical protein